MKKVMKKTLSFILTIAMVLTSLTVSDWSREEVKAANQTLYYNFRYQQALHTCSVQTAI